MVIKGHFITIKISLGDSREGKSKGMGAAAHPPLFLAPLMKLTAVTAEYTGEIILRICHFIDSVIRKTAT